MPNSFRLFAMLLLFAGIAAASWYVADQVATARSTAAIAKFQRDLAGALDDALAEQEATVEALSQRFETIDDLKTAQERQLRRHFNAAHVAMARQNGVGRVTGQVQIDTLVAGGQLVEIVENPYYRIQKLDYSVAYVTPQTAALLDEIGRRFQARLVEHRLPHYRYIISSGLRTAENQAALRLINPNATGGVSSHEFGTTVDIVFHTYDYVSRPTDALPPTDFAFLNGQLERIRQRAFDALGMRYWQELQGILGRVLIELQDEGRVLVLLEREQPVFHITTAE